MNETPDEWGSLFGRRCARCEYDLAGHPSGPTVCPECGAAFDEALLVLRGRHGGRRRGEPRSIIDFARMALSLGAVIAVMNFTTNFWLMMTLFTAIGLISFFIEPLLRREWGLEPANAAKLLIRREGFLQVDASDDLNGRKRWAWLPSTVGIVAIAAMCLSIGGYQSSHIWFGVVIGFIIAALARNRRDKLAKTFPRTDGEAGALIPWSAATRLAISPATWMRRTHILSIELHKVTRWTRTPLADFDWPTTPERAWQITTMLKDLARDAESDVHGLDRMQVPRLDPMERPSFH